jgi:hypothetical protein
MHEPSKHARDDVHHHAEDQRRRAHNRCETCRTLYVLWGGSTHRT